MGDRADGMEIWAIAHLPIGPLAAVSYGLELVFDRCLSQGQFLYGGERLRMSGRCEEIRRSSGYTNSENRKLKEFSELEWIPCSQLANWLKYQPECYSKRDDEFGDRDYQWYEEEGFIFNADTNTWRNCWRCREVSALYNTTRRTETEVKLELDLTNRTGSYIYYSCHETED